MSSFKKSPYLPLLFSLSAAVGTFGSTMVQAHGYMEFPPDHANACDKKLTTGDGLCSEAASSNKNGINQGTAGNNHQAVVFDHQLCFYCERWL